MRTLNKGDRVRLKHDVDLAIWRVKDNAGIVLDARSYGSSQTMVTADFGSRRVHIADTYLAVIND